MIPKYDFCVVMLLFLFVFYGCATPALWKATDPNEYVEISVRDISEEELHSKGIKYHRDNSSGAYYVEKNDLAKLKDYTIRVFATPVTVVVDVTLSIFVVGVLGAVWLIDNKIEEQEKERERKRDKCTFVPDCPYDGSLYKY